MNPGLADLARSLAARPRPVALTGAPEGYDAAAIGDLVAEGHVLPWLHVCRDDGRMARFAAALAFFHPELDALTFPAWDCLPYDRVSPNGEIVSRRIDTLTRLATGGADTPLVVLTTINALVQRAPPRGLFAGRVLTLRPGGRIGHDRLQSFFRNNGYIRTDTVREPGEFAVRGGILDLYPAGAPQPLRLDFFGDALESVRSFDPLTQRSTGAAAEAVLRPVSEVLLDDAAISRFRQRYREQFGATGNDDPLYEGVSAGRRYVGMEHWLPLYYERLETLLDYLPRAGVSFDHQADEAFAHRLEQIAEFYAARRNATGAARAGAPVYRPVRPDQLYLDNLELQRGLQGRPVVRLSPFAAAAGDGDRLDAGARPARNFAAERADPKVVLFEAVRDWLDAERKSGRHAAVAAFSEGSADRLATVLRERGLTDLRRVADGPALAALPPSAVGLAVLPLEQGFATDTLVLLGEQDILGDRLARVPRRRRNLDQFIAEATNLTPGDLVVHADHGIGRYEALETIDVAGAPHDCVRVLYAGDDKLYVPVENIEVLSRFGSEDAGVQLDRLGGVAWQSRKARVKQRIRDIAGELIRVAAERQLRPGEVLTPPDGVYEEFAARFPYPETEDQLAAIADTLADMASGKPMDRLICGDVGFGKTEVALRAAFIAAMAGGQVAVVVPTTLLARQHFRSFTERFAGLPLRIGQLSRLVPAKEARAVKAELAEGRLDIVIGTHALLAKDVRFAHLELLVVDEEQHFGVAQKEKLKQLKADVHVLTLTATPIPRTLQLALSGVREMSIIASPPIDRLAVRTFVMPYDPVTIREAIMRERDRGGQIFYVAPRIADLGEVQDRLRQIVPEIRLGVAHGRMAPSELEAVMTAFDERAFDLLVSTNIIESGLDIPSANTLDRAPRRHVRAGPALPAARPHRAGQDPRLRLSDPAGEEKAAADGATPARGLADIGHPGGRVSAGQPRPRHPRRRQPLGRRAVGPYPRGRDRALPADARGGGGRRPDRRRGPAGGMEPADNRRHAGPDPRSLRRRSGGAARALPAHRRTRRQARDRRLRRRADRPLRPAAGRGREPLADHRDQALVPRGRGRARRGRTQGRGRHVAQQPLRQPPGAGRSDPAQRRRAEAPPRPEDRLPAQLGRREDPPHRRRPPDAGAGQDRPRPGPRGRPALANPGAGEGEGRAAGVTKLFDYSKNSSSIFLR